MERLLPDFGPTTVAEQLAAFDPAALAGPERPYVFTNFALTVDGRTAIAGRSGKIGSVTDTAMLVGLRTRADAVMIGSGTLRAERYGRLLPDASKRAQRERIGLSQEPLAVLVSGSMDLPWDAPMFCEGGRILIFTTSEVEPPDTATALRVVRQEGENVDLAAALNHLRGERGIRSLLCEGGPVLHEALLREELVDELFITVGPQIGGGDSPGIAGHLEEGERNLELAWLLREQSELFARYRIVR